MYVFPIILNWLSVLPPFRKYRTVSEWALAVFPLLGRMQAEVLQKICDQCPCHVGAENATHRVSSTPWVWFSYADSLWMRSVRTGLSSLTIGSTSSKAKGCHKNRKQSEFFHECWNALHATLGTSGVWGSHQTHCEQLSLSVTKLHSFWSWAPVVNYLSNLEFPFTFCQT